SLKAKTRANHRSQARARLKCVSSLCAVGPVIRIAKFDGGIGKRRQLRLQQRPTRLDAQNERQQVLQIMRAREANTFFVQSRLEVLFHALLTVKPDGVE